jgi:XapX domain-containing protein
MTNIVTVLAFLTGLLTGGLFAYLEIPIPARSSIAGILGIVGIYAGFNLIQFSGRSFDVLGALGL